MQNQLENRVYAGFFVRLVAFIIDSIIAALVVGIVKLPFSIAAMGGVGFLKANFIFEYSFLDVLGYIGVASYFVLLTYFAHSTPGKMLLHLEVVTSNGEWTFLNVLYRETVGRFLSSLLCIGYLAVLVTKEKQGFHDMLCDTHVVYAKMMPLTVSPQPVVTAAEGVGAVSGAMPESVEDALGAVPESGGDVPGAMPESSKDSLVTMSESSVEIPVYHETSTKSYDHMNPDCTNLENLGKKDFE